MRASLKSRYKAQKEYSERLRSVLEERLQETYIAGRRDAEEQCSCHCGRKDNNWHLCPVCFSRYEKESFIKGRESLQEEWTKMFVKFGYKPKKETLFEWCTRMKKVEAELQNLLLKQIA